LSFVRDENKKNQRAIRERSITCFRGPRDTASAFGHGLARRCTVAIDRNRVRDSFTDAATQPKNGHPSIGIGTQNDVARTRSEKKPPRKKKRKKPPVPLTQFADVGVL
jgi:hypothetical protein